MGGSVVQKGQTKTLISLYFFAVSTNLIYVLWIYSLNLLFLFYQSVRPSVCPSRYLLLNRWTKFNQIWCVSCSHGKGVQLHIFFGPAPWGPGEGPKGQILLDIIKFLLQSQFQRFSNQTLCVFSQMKDIKHIRRDFHSLAWVMPLPQGSDLGVPWGVEWSKKKIFRNSTRIGK